MRHSFDDRLDWQRSPVSTTRDSIDAIDCLVSSCIYLVVSFDSSPSLCVFDLPATVDTHFNLSILFKVTATSVSFNDPSRNVFDSEIRVDSDETDSETPNQLRRSMDAVNDFLMAFRGDIMVSCDSFPFSCVL